MPVAISQPEHAARVRRRFESVRANCLRADEAERQRTQATGNLQSLRVTNTSDTLGTASDLTISRFLLATPFAVLVVDFLLIYPVVDFLLNPVFEGSARIGAALLFPLAIILMELCVGSFRRSAYLLSLEDDNRGALQLWQVVTCVFALVMPVGAVATYLVSDYDFDRAVSAGFIVMLAALSLVCHVTMLYGGPRIIDAISDLSFRRQTAQLQRSMARTEQLYRQASQRAGEDFSSGVRDLESYNRRFANARMEAGPFDALTKRILRSHFGYDVIQQPDGEAPAPTPPTPPGTEDSPESGPVGASASPQASSDRRAETSPQATNFEQRVRDEEREVRA